MLPDMGDAPPAIPCIDSSASPPYLATVNPTPAVRAAAVRPGITDGVALDVGVETGGEEGGEGDGAVDMAAFMIILHSPLPIA